MTDGQKILFWIVFVLGCLIIGTGSSKYIPFPWMFPVAGIGGYFWGRLCGAAWVRLKK